jgi:hypothetical protein
MSVATAPAYRNLVGGELLDAVDGATRDIVNPATGAVIGSVPEGTQSDVDRAMEAARAARIPWRDTTPGQRMEHLLALADAVDRHADELAALESANVGKPRSLAGEELPICSDELRFFAGAARTAHAPAAGEYSEGHTSFVRREPVGVVGQIAPWNYPLMMAIWKLAPALAAGNVVVLKPSEITPLTTLRLAELAAEVLPAGVLNIITGEGDPVGRGIVTHSAVAMVSLTGSVPTGKWIARAAADSVKRVHLELGGKAPARPGRRAKRRSRSGGTAVTASIRVRFRRAIVGHKRARWRRWASIVCPRNRATPRGAQASPSSSLNDREPSCIRPSTPSGAACHARLRAGNVDPARRRRRRDPNLGREPADRARRHVAAGGRGCDLLCEVRRRVGLADEVRGPKRARRAAGPRATDLVGAGRHATLSRPHMTGGSAVDVRSNPIVDRAEWARQRARAAEDPGGFHGAIAKH